MNSKWIVPMKKNPGARMSLFCFPHSGGSARVFKAWGELLPSSIEVFGIQYPGRGSRFPEPAITVMETMVAEVEKAIQPFLKRPFALFGHSLGGGIALDLARSLQVAGKPTNHLFISGRRAAHLPRNRKRLHGLPEDEFREEVFGMGGMSKEMTEHPELMDMVSPILRADLSISEKYTFDPTVTLSAPLTALSGEEDPLVDKESVAAWSQHTTSTFAHHFFPGAHFYIDTARQAVLDQVLASLKLSYSNL